MLERTRFLLRLRRGRVADLDQPSPVVAPTPAPSETTPSSDPTHEAAVDTLEPAARAPLSDFRGVGRQGREPQCPSCGRFTVAHERTVDELDLVCSSCHARWSWRLGAPWPRTIPRPSLDEPIKE